MWDLPGPGLEPESPPLAGRLLTTAPPGKPLRCFFILRIWVGYVLLKVVIWGILKFILHFVHKNALF